MSASTNLGRLIAACSCNTTRAIAQDQRADRWSRYQISVTNLPCYTSAGNSPHYHARIIGCYLAIGPTWLFIPSITQSPSDLARAADPGKTPNQGLRAKRPCMSVPTQATRQANICVLTLGGLLRRSPTTNERPALVTMVPVLPALTCRTAHTSTYDTPASTTAASALQLLPQESIDQSHMTKYITFDQRKA